MKTKAAIYIGALFCIAAADALRSQVELPQYKVTIRTIDESQQPVSGVNVSLAFAKPVSGITDGNGLFTAEGACGIAGFGGSITKDGFYRGGGEIPHPDGNNIDKVLNHWLPWNPTVVVVMRPILHPIAMYARKIAVKVPGDLNQPCGFDLEKADWVAPYGKGEATDFIVTFTKAEVRSDMDYEASATISFPNQGDGIQEIKLPKEFAGSAFKWPRIAPETSYKPTLEAHRRLKNTIVSAGSLNINTAGEEQAHFLRVRTIENGGYVRSALYGKMKGGFYISPDKTGHGFIEFTYYLNPTQLDRNMEFNPQQNLFKGLTSVEAPRDP